jgi:hypothetical protein
MEKEKQDALEVGKEEAQETEKEDEEKSGRALAVIGLSFFLCFPYSCSLQEEAAR